LQINGGFHGCGLWSKRPLPIPYPLPTRNLTLPSSLGNYYHLWKTRSLGLPYHAIPIISKHPDINLKYRIGVFGKIQNLFIKSCTHLKYFLARFEWNIPPRHCRTLNLLHVGVSFKTLREFFFYKNYVKLRSFDLSLSWQCNRVIVKMLSSCQYHSIMITMSCYHDNVIRLSYYIIITISWYLGNVIIVYWQCYHIRIW
jgi:hypothetical protein